MGFPANTPLGTATVREAKRGGAPAAGAWVVTIPGWTPVSVNRLIGCSRFKAADLKRKDADRVAGEVLVAGVPRATGKRLVAVRYQVPNLSRAQDPDNGSKSLRDALVACGMILDDSASAAVFVEPVVEKGKKATVIRIEDVP
jgi:hypothetical protein